MGSYDDLRNVLKHISDETGDKKAWQQGLTEQQIRDVDGWLNSEGTGYKGFRDPQTGVTYEDRGGLNTNDTPQVPDDALNRIRGQHPTLFDPTTKAAIAPAPGTAGNTPQPNGQTGNGQTGQTGNGQAGNTEATVPTDEQNKGDAAKAAKKLEDNLQDANDKAVDADRELAQAVLNAHATTAESAESLNRIQQEITAAVNSTAIDTPMGRREFQKFLLFKIEKIRDVLLNAKLDAESQKNGLIALSDYLRTNQPGNNSGDQQQQGNGNGNGQQQGNGQGGNGGNGGGGGGPADPGLPADLGGDLGGLGDPGLGGGGDPLSRVAESATPALQSAAQIPAQLAGIPGQLASGMGSLPGMFGAGANNPANSHLTDPFKTDDNKNRDSHLPDDAALAGLFGDEPPTDNGTGNDHNGDNENGDNKDKDKEGKPDDHPKPGEPVINPNAPGALPTTGPTPVTIGGVTYTADNPKLAAAITDISKGTPPLEAFRKYDIAIAPPTSPPAAPLDPSQLKFGSYGTYSNGDIVVALDKQRAIIDGQVQPISSAASKPGFIAWQNPPAPTGTPTIPPVIAAATPATPAPATPTPLAAPITQTSGHTGSK